MHKDGPVPRYQPELGPCWLWTGATDEYGYGRFRPDPKKKSKWKKAHRYSYELKYGAVTAGKLVCHHCDNPPCINPDHLFTGTHKDNHDDAISKGRAHLVKAPHGEAYPSAELTEMQIREIRRLIAAGVWIADIARHYKRPYGTIYGAVMGENWKHLGSPVPKKRHGGKGIRCTKVEGSPPRSCQRKASTLAEGPWGAMYLCSGHALRILIGPGTHVSSAKALK